MTSRSAALGKTLNVSIPGPDVASLKGWSVMVSRSTTEELSVACVLYAVDSALPTTVTLGAIYAYATGTIPPYESCQVISASLLSSQALVPETIYDFDGAQWVAVGPTPEGFLHGLGNARTSGGPVGAGLAQAIGLNGAASVDVPLDLQALPIDTTTFFPANEVYRIGLVKIGGLNPAPGLLLATSILDRLSRTPAPTCVVTSNRFTTLDFTGRETLNVEYSAATNTFRLTDG